MFNSLDKVDWNLLHQQKRVLLKIREDQLAGSSEREALSGIIHLLDALQDDAFHLNCTAPAPSVKQQKGYRCKMITLPKIESYGEYSSNNYGAHTLKVWVGSLTVYFSYQTPIAYRGKNGLVVRENDWSTTTGKHLNWIDGGDKKSRVSGEKFEQQLLDELVAREPQAQDQLV